MNELDAKQAIDEAVDFAFDGPPRPRFTVGDIELEYVVYALGKIVADPGDAEHDKNEVLTKLTSMILDSIYREDKRLTLAWRRAPKVEQYDETVKASMRLVLYDENLAPVGLPAPLKEEGAPPMMVDA